MSLNQPSRNEFDESERKPQEAADAPFAPDDQTLEPSSADFEADDSETPVDADRWRRGRFRVLRNAAIFMVVGLALIAASPWLLPLRAVEGPLVQNVTPASAMVVWYLSRDDACAMRFPSMSGAGVPTVELTAEGRRRAALVRNLPAEGVEYVIAAGARELARGRLRPAPPPESPLRMLVFGDSGEGVPAQYALGKRMATTNPDLLVHTGDLVYPNGARGDYRRKFFLPYAPLLASTSFWPCLGNHDVSAPTADAYREVFALPENGPEGLAPEHNYWFDFGAARLVMLDSNLDEAALDNQVAPWLTRVFADCPPGRWRFVVFHHAPFTTWGKHPNKNSLKIRRSLVPAIERAHVDVVFCGHEHMYLRTEPIRGETPAPDGVTYIISGAGGGRLYDPAPEEQWPSWLAKWHNARHSFTLIEIDGHELRLTQQDADGAVIDEWMTTRAAP